MTDTVKVAKGASKVASAISKVLDTVSKQGNIITQCVTSVRQVYKGKAVPEADERFIANSVARLRKWSAKSAGPRKSEVRKMVRHYTRLPEAMQKVGAADGNFTWHDAMRLLTCLNAEPALTKAVARFNTKPTAASVTPLKGVGSACKRLINLDSVAGSKARLFQDAVQTLADTHGIDYE